MKRLLGIVLSVVLLIGMLPMGVFADETPATVVQKVEMRSASNATVNRGTSAYITIVSKSNTEDGYLLQLDMDSELSIKNGVSGVINSTDEKTSIYEIAAKSNAEIGNHKIMVKAISAATEEVLQVKEIQVMVISDNPSNSYGGSTTPAAGNVSYMLSGGDAIYAKDINTLTVSLYNRGGTTMRNCSLSITLPSGMTIQSGAGSKYVGNLVTNKTVTADFPIVCDSNIKDGSYEITVIANGFVLNTYGSGENEYSKWEKADPITEKFYVPVKDGKASDTTEETVGTPILMVTNYSCGGTVTAGENFGLGLTLENTSKQKLQNIKVTLSGDFVPVGSSSSFYIESVEAGASAQKTMVMNCSRDKAQGRYPITVSMSYETTDGKGFTSSDVISVPVIQQTRLVIDNILDPGYLTVGNSAYVSVNYRNLGDNQIKNLQIHVEGDFSLDGDANYFAGNMAAGRQDSYSFSLYPNQAGEMLGSVTFTYEDADGNEHNIVKEFKFNVGENTWEDPGYIEPEPVPTGLNIPKWAYGVAAAVGVVLLIVIIKAVKKHKAKKLEALDLDE